MFILDNMGYDLRSKGYMEDEIKRLEKRSKELEEKTVKLEKILENMMAEFENLEKLKIERLPAVPLGKKIRMQGGREEDNWLSTGWHDSEGRFRWAGKDGKHAIVHFKVVPNKRYLIVTEFFVPRYIAKKRVSIFANDKEIHRFVAGKEGRFEKVIEIPAEIVNDELLSIQFRAALWSPKKMGINDNRKLSLAFRHIELRA